MVSPAPPIPASPHVVAPPAPVWVPPPPAAAARAPARRHGRGAARRARTSPTPRPAPPSAPPSPAPTWSRARRARPAWRGGRADLVRSAGGAAPPAASRVLALQAPAAAAVEDAAGRRGRRRDPPRRGLRHAGEGLPSIGRELEEALEAAEDLGAEDLAFGLGGLRRPSTAAAAGACSARTRDAAGGAAPPADRTRSARPPRPGWACSPRAAPGRGGRRRALGGAGRGVGDVEHAERHLGRAGAQGAAAAAGGGGTHTGAGGATTCGRRGDRRRGDTIGAVVASAATRSRARARP